MPGISDTAYPRLKPNPSPKELDEVYTPDLFEGSWVEDRTRVMISEVPKPILQHIAACAGYDAVPEGLAEYDTNVVTRYRSVGLSSFGSLPEIGPKCRVPESGPRTFRQHRGPLV
jgi:hypothetical protein